tara:strand:- start:5871 stop:6098 length:228 start_codon:yes stop_codon:yes gene_type:complete
MQLPRGIITVEEISQGLTIDKVLEEKFSFRKNDTVKFSKGIKSKVIEVKEDKVSVLIDGMNSFRWVNKSDLEKVK